MKISIQWLQRTESFIFRKEVTIREVIQQAADRMQLSPEYVYGLLLSGNASTPLSPEQTLASSGAQDGDLLFLTVTSIRQPKAA